uniref:Putative microtubule-associated protein futsch isoform X1 n=1 Tax=Davidia involucrata TaxID=16924 RepID=A0A5B6YGL3_DAVIN
MSSYEDLPKFGADCNGIKHVDDDGEGINSTGKDGPDGSYVFFSRSNSETDDPVVRDWNVNFVNESNVVPEPKVKPPNKDVEVQARELNAQNNENAELCVQNNCIVEGTDVAASNSDVTPQGSLVKPDGDGGEGERTYTVEEQNGTGALYSEPQQLDDELKSEEQIELKFAPDLKENLESQSLDFDAGDCELPPLDDGKVKSEEGDNLESAIELGKVQESQIIVLPYDANSEEQDILESTAELEKSQEPQIMVPWAADFKMPEVDVEKVKSEEDTKLESAREVKESLESQITITDSAESEYYQLDNGERNLDEENKTDFDIDVKENQECDIMVTDNVDSGLVQGKKAASLANETDVPLETEIAHDPVPDGNKDSLPTSHVEDGISQTEVLNESINGSQRISEVNGSSENDESPPSSAKVETVPVEGGDDDGTMVKQEVGCGASLTTESFPTCAADDTKPETEVENFNVKSRETVLSYPVDDAKSEMQVENGPDGGTSWPANDVSSETDIRFGSIDPEEILPSSPCDVVNINSEVPNGVTAYACNQPIYEPLQNGSSADVKSESEVENSSSISNGDLSGNVAAASRLKILDDSVDDNESGLNCIPEVVHVENLGDLLNGGDEDGGNKLTCQETEDIEGIDRNGISTSSPEGCGADSLDGQNVGVETGKRSFHFLIRIPRYDDENLREQVRHAQLQVDEKTQLRDAIRAGIQMKRANFHDYHTNYEAAKSEERAARGSVKSKRQEIDSVQFVINRAKNAISVEDIDGKIHNMEHMIQHETLPLKEEKHFIREIKQLKQLREQISSNMGSQDEVKQALDQRDQIEERLKILKKELDCLREKVSKAKAIAESAEKKSKDENEKLKELQAQFRAADDIRQEAYAHLQSLRKQLYEKNKHFRMYKDDATAANDYALSGDREALHRLCVNQVETIMELWNKNDEFRKEYVRCNTRSTLRRLKTLDGRSLGPDEQPPLLPNVVDERVDRSLFRSIKANSVLLTSTLEQGKQGTTVEGEEADFKSTVKVAEQKNQTVKTNKHAKTVLGNGSATVSGRDENEETKEEENKQTKEELELARKAEELRKEEAAARLKEQRRLEEKAKAKEALERKKRNAEKAQIRAEIRAQKEAEQKDRERDKRARKKDRKKATAAEAPDGNNEGETAPTSETPIETMEEPGIRESPMTVTKRPQKPSQFTKQSKAKSIPPPLRNRGKRRMQQWMWVILPTLLVLALFLLGNGSFSQNFWLRSFGF